MPVEQSHDFLLLIGALEELAIDFNNVELLQDELIQTENGSDAITCLFLQGHLFVF